MSLKYAKKMETLEKELNTLIDKLPSDEVAEKVTEMKIVDSNNHIIHSDDPAPEFPMSVILTDQGKFSFFDFNIFLKAVYRIWVESAELKSLEIVVFDLTADYYGRMIRVRPTSPLVDMPYRFGI